MRDRIKKCCTGFFSYEVNRFEIVCSVLISAVLFLNLYYEDNLSMFLCYFWNNEGLFNWYSMGWLGNNRLPYGIVQQFIGQAWCLPVNIWYHLFGIEQVANTWTVLWYKLCVVPFFILMIRELLCISKHIGVVKEEQRWMVVLFCSSALVSLPVFHIAQTDVIYLFLMLRGLRCYLQDDYKKYLVYMMLAIDCKYMALFVFIPLVLLYEKRILHIFKDCIIGGILIPIQMIWYRLVEKIDDAVFLLNSNDISQNDVVNASVVKDNINEAYVGFLSHFYNKTLFFELPAIRKTYVASVLIVIFGLLCVWCYLKHSETREENVENTLYVGFLSLLIFFSWSSPNPYWMVALYPITFLMMFFHKERLRINLIIESVYSGSMFLILIDSLPHVFGGPNNFNFMPLKEWFGFIPDHSDMPVEMGPSVYGFLKKLGVSQFMPVIVAICLVSFICWTIINYPSEKNEIRDHVSEKEMALFLHNKLLLNNCLLIIWLLLSIYCISRY